MTKRIIIKPSKKGFFNWDIEKYKSLTHPHQKTNKNTKKTVENMITVVFQYHCSERVDNRLPNNMYEDTEKCLCSSFLY